MPRNVTDEPRSDRGCDGVRMRMSFADADLPHVLTGEHAEYGCARVRRVYRTNSAGSDRKNSSNGIPPAPTRTGRAVGWLAMNAPRPDTFPGRPLVTLMAWPADDLDQRRLARACGQKPRDQGTLKVGLHRLILPHGHNLLNG